MSTHATHVWQVGLCRQQALLLERTTLHSSATPQAQCDARPGHHARLQRLVPPRLPPRLSVRVQVRRRRGRVGVAGPLQGALHQWLHAAALRRLLCAQCCCVSAPALAPIRPRCAPCPPYPQVHGAGGHTGAQRHLITCRPRLCSAALVRRSTSPSLLRCWPYSSAAPGLPGMHVIFGETEETRHRRGSEAGWQGGRGVKKGQ